MNKTTKYIIGLLVAIVVLGGGWFALRLTDPNSTQSAEESSESSAVENVLIKKDEETLESIKVKNQYSEYTILQKTQALAESSETSEDSSEAASSEATTTIYYTIEGFEDYSLKSATLKSGASNMFDLSYVKEIGETEKLDDYGLGEGAATATAKFTDETTEEIKIGSAAGESNGNYILYGGKVYIASINTMYTTSLETQINPASWTIADYEDTSGNTFSFLRDIKVSGENYPRNIHMTYNEDTGEYKLTEPMECAGSTVYSETLMTALKEFAATSTVKVKATDADLKEYGLDVPYAQVEFTINDASHSITAGAKNGADRYIYVDGDKTTVYLIAAETLAPWADVTEEKFRDSFVKLVNITAINKLTVEIDGKTNVIEFARTKNEEKSTDDQIMYDYTATVDGKEAVYTDVTSMYTSLIGIALLNIQETEHSGEPQIKFTYNYYDGSAATVVEYYKTADDRYTATVDGVYAATVRGTSVDAFIKDFNSFLEKVNNPTE